MGGVNELLRTAALPKMVRVRQHFDASALSGVESAVERELERPEIRETIRPGMRVAIAAGSRGIRHYPNILRTIADWVRARGAQPFLIPAMGSHGGATPEGQLALLAGLGITEETIGVPIIATMDVVWLGETPRGVSVWFSRDAAEADATILVNRVKPHTAFHGPVESGITKMGVIGCGKQKGAEQFHSLGMENMADNLREMGAVMIRESNVAFAVALLENAYDETFHVEAVVGRDLLTREPELLDLAKARFPRILFPELDVLVVQRIGKDISGDGADPNITGRFYAPGIQGSPQVQRIAYLDLTPASHGNAIGMGVADFITRKLWEKVDLESIYMNTVTNCVIPPAKIPLIMDTEELAIRAAVRTLLHTDKEHVRLVCIQDTLHLGEIRISEALLPQAEATPGIEILSQPEPMRFDSAGNLI